MIQQTQLTAKDIREDLLDIATTHLSLHAQGYTANDELLYDVLAKAASDNISIEAACKELDRGIGGNRMRELLHEQLRV